MKITSLKAISVFACIVIFSLKYFGTSQESALSILAKEKEGCSFNAFGAFKFDCNEELQTITYAIADHKNDILAKINEMISGIHTQALSLELPADKKEFFVTECQELEGLITRAQARTTKLHFALAADAKQIGPRSYALCNLFSTLENLSKMSATDKKAQESAEQIAGQSFSMYQFVRMQG